MGVLSQHCGSMIFHRVIALVISVRLAFIQVKLHYKEICMIKTWKIFTELWPFEFYRVWFTSIRFWAISQQLQIGIHWHKGSIINTRRCAYYIYFHFCTTHFLLFTYSCFLAILRQHPSVPTITWFCFYPQSTILQQTTLNIILAMNRISL